MVEETSLQFSFSDSQKVAMIMLLDQYDDWYISIHEIKNCLMVQGSVVLRAQQAIILARLVAPHWPPLAAKIEMHRGIKHRPAFTPEQHEARSRELIKRYGSPEVEP